MKVQVVLAAVQVLIRILGYLANSFDRNGLNYRGNDLNRKKIVLSKGLRQLREMVLLFNSI